MSKMSTIRMRAKRMSFWTRALTVKPTFRWPEQSSSRKLLSFWTLYSSLHDTVFGLQIQLFSVTDQENWRAASLIKQYNQKCCQSFAMLLYQLQWMQRLPKTSLDLAKH
jgi:hypothetical protein